MSELNTGVLDPSTAAAAVDPGTGAGATGVQPIRLTDDALVDLGDGKPVKWKDHNTGVLFHRDYTQKTQALAEERRQFQERNASWEREKQETETLREQMRGALSDPAKLSQLYMAAQMRGQQQQQPQPLTTQDVGTLEERLLAKLQTQFTNQTQQWQQAQAQERMSQQLNQMVESGIKEFPALGVFGQGISPGVFNQIHTLVETGTIPKTVEAVQQQIKVILQGYADGLTSHFDSERKAAALKKQKAAGGIEPAGGHGVLPEKRKYKGKDDPQREKDMADFLTQALSGEE